MKINAINFKAVCPLKAEKYSNELITAYKTAKSPENVEVTPDKISYYTLEGALIKYQKPKKVVSYFDNTEHMKAKEIFVDNTIRERTVFYPNAKAAYAIDYYENGKPKEVSIFHRHGELLQNFNYESNKE